MTIDSSNIRPRHRKPDAATLQESIMRRLAHLEEQFGTYIEESYFSERDVLDGAVPGIFEGLMATESDEVLCLMHAGEVIREYVRRTEEEEHEVATISEEPTLQGVIYLGGLRCDRCAGIR